MSLAIYEHHTEIAILLVHRGADINIVEEVKYYIACIIIMIIIATLYSL